MARSASRVQTTTFSPVDVIEMFLAQTGRSDSAPSSRSLPVSHSSDAWRSTLFPFPSGGFWDTQSLSAVSELVATGDDWP